MEFVRLSSKGQIVIPTEIRKVLELKKGDRMLIEKHDHNIILKPIMNLSRLRGADKDSWKDTSKEVEKIREEWDEEF